jgi:hypothetical protein
MIFHSPLLNILINLVSVGKYNFLNWGTFVPQGTVYGVFLMGTVPGLTTSGIFAFFLARQPQDVLLHRFPPVKPCANEHFPYPLVILRLGATLTRP